MMQTAICRWGYIFAKIFNNLDAVVGVPSLHGGILEGLWTTLWMLFTLTAPLLFACLLLMEFGNNTF